VSDGIPSHSLMNFTAAIVVLGEPLHDSSVRTGSSAVWTASSATWKWVLA
jgi:hypothetical protein